MLIESISYGNVEQVKLTTTKLMQNKEENKNSEFWNDNNGYPLHLEGTWRETNFNLLFFDRLMRRDAQWPYTGVSVWWNRHHFSENSIMNMPHVQQQNKGKMKRRMKTLYSKMVTIIAWASWGKIATLLIYQLTDAMRCVAWCVARVDVLRKTGNE